MSTAQRTRPYVDQKTPRCLNCLILGYLFPFHTRTLTLTVCSRLVLERTDNIYSSAVFEYSFKAPVLYLNILIFSHLKL